MKHEKFYDTHPLASLKELVDQGASRFGDKPAFLVKEVKGGPYIEISYRKLKEDVDALGTMLIEMGLEGARIGVMGPNSYQWVLAYFAAVNGTGTVVPLDKELSAHEIENLVRAGEITVAFAAEEYKGLLSRAGVPHIFGIDFYQTDRSGEADHITGLMAGGRELVEHGDRRFQDAHIDNRAVTAILFTSGTTGEPKGVMLSHLNMVTVIRGTAGLFHLEEGTCSLSVLPIHHTFECTVDIMEVLFQGCAIAFCEGLKYVVRNMQESKATIIVAVPLIIESIYEKIWKQAKDTKKDGLLRAAISLNKTLTALGINQQERIFQSVYRKFGGGLRNFISGAASLNPNVVRGLMDLGFHVSIGYGLTETAPLISGVPDFDSAILYNRPGTCGRVMPSGELRIADPDPEGIGEIAYKGDNVMLGYFNMPDETAKVIKDGWFYTGDLGFMDKDGWLYITGRKKNVIVTKTGKNIYPEELEELLKDNPYIKESMVYGKEEDKGEGMRVAVQVVLDMEAVEEAMGPGNSDEEIHAFIKDSLHALNEKLPSYKRIRDLKIRGDEFVKTTTKKIKRADNLKEK